MSFFNTWRLPSVRGARQADRVVGWSQHLISILQATSMCLKGFALQPHKRERPPSSSSTRSLPRDGRQSPLIWCLTPSSTPWELKIKGPLPCFLHCQPFPPPSMAPPHVCFNNCLPPSLILTPSLLLLLSSPLLSVRGFCVHRGSLLSVTLADNHCLAAIAPLHTRPIN